jgi:hypothetical protein
MRPGTILGRQGTFAALVLAASCFGSGCSSMGNGFGSCCLMNRHEPPLTPPIQAPAPVVNPPTTSAVATPATSAVTAPMNPTMPSQ